jgi:hypothetical protein
MRLLVLILSLSLLLSALTPDSWAGADPDSQRNSALHAAHDALPAFAGAGRGDDLHRGWLDEMKVRLLQRTSLELPLELRISQLPVTGKCLNGSVPSTLLTDHVRQQV